MKDRALCHRRSLSDRRTKAWILGWLDSQLTQRDPNATQSTIVDQDGLTQSKASMKLKLLLL